MYSTKGLKSFLFKAAQNTWAGGSSSVKANKDHETIYSFEEGDWRYEDTFFGEKPNGSREVVYYKGEPIWVMTSYGCIYDDIGDHEEVYGFLRSALKSRSGDELSVKGPSSFEDSGYRYFNNINGTIERFSGEELIFHNKNEVYTAVYSGGYINRSSNEKNRKSK